MIRYQALLGSDAAQFKRAIGEWRIRWFRDYPYLYDGRLEDEEKYMDAFLAKFGAMVVTAHDHGQLVAVSTALPLKSDHQIGGENRSLLESRGIDAERTFLFSECIVRPDYRRKGVGKKIVGIQEAHARNTGHRCACFLAVIRPLNHSLRPAGYAEPEIIWQQFGFENSGAVFSYEWLTLVPDGVSRKMKNEMALWIKEL